MSRRQRRRRLERARTHAAVMDRVRHVAKIKSYAEQAGIYLDERQLWLLRTWSW